MDIHYSNTTMDGCWIGIPFLPLFKDITLLYEINEKKVFLQHGGTHYYIIVLRVTLSFKLHVIFAGLLLLKKINLHFNKCRIME